MVKKKKNPLVGTQDISYTRFTHRKEEKDEEQERNTVEVEKRHYCRYCKRKRDESFMSIVGQGAYGKKSWACNDSKVCKEVQLLKRKR